MPHWPPQPASDAQTGRPARKVKPATNGLQPPGRTVRASGAGLDAPGKRLTYPIGTYCALNKEWELRK
jgi:hypothetical protein